jgi:hypothetical protein
VDVTTKEKHWGTDFKKVMGHPDDFVYKIKPLKPLKHLTNKVETEAKPMFVDETEIEK